MMQQPFVAKSQGNKIGHTLCVDRDGITLSTFNYSNTS